MSDYTLKFPCDISEELGLPTNTINAFKGKGCRFFGKKTSVVWVREYLDKITAPEEEAAAVSATPARLPRSTSSKPCGRASKNG